MCQYKFKGIFFYTECLSRHVLAAVTTCHASSCLFTQIGLLLSAKKCSQSAPVLIKTINSDQASGDHGTVNVTVSVGVCAVLKYLAYTF